MTMLATEIKLPSVKRAFASIERKRRGMVATRESHGPWYYLYLAPKWKLVALPMEGDDTPDHTHEIFWTEHCVEVIAEHYRIHRRLILELKELTHAMPRGRCIFTPKGNHRHWTLYHGNDFPLMLDRNDEEKNVLGAFSLAVPAIRGWTHFEYARHEEMSARQQKEIQKLLGPVPY